MNGVKFPEGAM